MIVVLTLNYRNVCEDERGVDFLVENCAVILLRELSHFNIGAYFRELVDVVVTECGDQLWGQTLLCDPYHSFGA